MHSPGRNSSRHMKGRQVALTLYLPPNKYWLLKAVSERTRTSMQTLLRRSLDEILIQEHARMPLSPPVEARSERTSDPAPLSAP